MKYFYDNSNAKGVVPEIAEEDSPQLILPSTDLDKEFITNINIKNLVTKRNGHCALLDTGIFRTQKNVYKNIPVKLIIKLLSDILTKLPLVVLLR